MRQKTSQHDFWIGVLGIVILLLLIAAIIVGLVSIIAWFIGGLRHVDISAEKGAIIWVGSLFTDMDQSGARQISVEKIAVLFTALATTFLAIATVQLHRATHRLVAADAPLLEINLYLSRGDAPTVDDARIERYPERLNAEDAEHFERARLQPPTYIYIEIRNDQTEPFAAARDIEVKVELRSDDLPETLSAHSSFITEVQGQPAVVQTRIMVRSVAIQVLGPRCAELHPVFNVAALAELKAEVQSVRYYDLRGQKGRSAAFGEVVLSRGKDGVVSTEGGYSEPAKWEMP